MDVLDFLRTAAIAGVTDLSSSHNLFGFRHDDNRLASRSDKRDVQSVKRRDLEYGSVALAWR